MSNIGRNDQCSCGSGKKYKKCCLQKDMVSQIGTACHIQLDDFRINGVAINNALAGEEVSILTRAVLTSDEPEFYPYMKMISELISDRAQKKGTTLFLNQVSHILLVTHVDGTADLYIQNVPMAIEILTKHDLIGGQIIYRSNIADIRRVSFPGVKFNPTDGILTCFKVGWKFGMFFDLSNNRDLDTGLMERTLGDIYRLLSFEEAYLALGNPNTFTQIVKAGWFPFVEIIGGEFEELLHSYKANFNINEQERKIVQKFDDNRIDEIGRRWWNRESLKTKQAILESALSAFKRSDPVACLKIILTEIEGVIQDAHIANLGKTEKIFNLLKYAADQGTKRSGSETSLLFAKEFLKYLSEYTFQHFDPQKPQAGILSRHSAGHGAATAEAYTQVRALQAILTLDQLSFYL